MTDSVFWTSSNPEVVTISNDRGGEATMLAPGVARIVVPVVWGSRSASVTMTDTPLVSIAVTPPMVSVSLGDRVTFTATGTYSDGTRGDLTRVVDWRSSDGAVAIPSDSPFRNRVVAVGVGTATIRATAGTVVGSATFIVTAPESN
jgi:uncharacterized protein YjdB